MPVKRKSKKETAEAALQNVSSSASTSVATNPPEVITEPVVLQLPISNTKLDEIISGQDMTSILEYNPTIVDPQPYIPTNSFTSCNDVLIEDKQDVPAQVHASQAVKADNKHNPSHMEKKEGCTNSDGSHHTSVCYWCCHNVEHMEYGMPIRYDVFHKNFTMFGTFCSLECAAAYNYSTHMGSDRVWEIHSWIQMLAHRYGYSGMVRPAPSRYLLKLFNGPLGIEEFRNVHKGLTRTYVLNIPPFIHVPSQMEILNTSFLDKKSMDACVIEKTARPKKKLSAFHMDEKEST